MKGDTPKARAPKKGKCTTKMEFSMDQHGKVPLAVTAEYATPEETAKNARKAISLFKGICEENNFKMGDSPF